jgi:glutamate/tyrosine decarboxylase-like PLP-dependent enzyme
MSDRDPLTLSSDDMRALGYRVIDMLVEHFETLPEKPVTRKADRASMEARLREDLPEGGTDPLLLLDQVTKDVFENVMHLDHPRFFAFVPSPSNFVGVMAEVLAAGFNVFAGTWLEASGPAQIELVTIDWLRAACGLPASAGGLFVSGGSMANITALAVARHVALGDRTDGASVYTSDQAHSSVERGLWALGFHEDQLHRVPSDDGFRLDLSALRRAVEADRAAGRVPFCVVANAGTTNTGAVDPLPELADYCDRDGLWLHVDGAYGAAAALCERGRAALEGLGRADSLSLDPHKWLFQPYEIGCVLVRDERWLRETFHILPEYLVDIEGQAGEVNFCDRGIQLTRSFRALKLWMSLKTFGRAEVEAALNRGFDLAELAEAALRETPDWAVVTPAQMGVLTFRCVPHGLPEEALNRLNRELVDATVQDGFAMLSSTVLRGATVLRMCTINPRSTEVDMRETIRRLDGWKDGWLEDWKAGRLVG